MSYQQCIMTVRFVRLAKEAHYSRGSLHMPGRQKVGEEGRMAVKLARHSVTTWVALIFVVLCNLFYYMARKDVRIKG